MRIAIVGSGVSGLVAAWVLQRDHEVTVFEAGDWIGGHTHTVDVDLDGERLAVDTGFIVYNEHTYPHFSRLLTRLGVSSQPTDMSFSVVCDRSGVEWASHGLRGVLAQPGNLLRPGFRRMLRDMPRFNREAQRLLAMEGEKATLEDFLFGAGFSQEFVDWYVLPMGAAIWSADPGHFLRFPAASFARFFANHGLLDRRQRVPWRAVRGGSRSYVDALTAGFRDRIRLRTPVRSVRRHSVGVELETAFGETLAFDKLVLATHSNQALRLLADPSQRERRVLGAIGYQPNDVVLHTDASLMPRRKAAHASWNYRVGSGSHAAADVTYDMTRLQGLASRRKLLVSLNASERIDPEQILGRWMYEHPVFDADALAAQKLHRWIDGTQHTHFCGAYWGWGFHEDGVRSALEVCAALGSGF